MSAFQNRFFVLGVFGILGLLFCLGTPAPAQTLEYHPGTARKILQLTGDYDPALRLNTLTQTLTKAHLQRTDLGEPFEHNGNLWFLFGDTQGAYSGLDDSCGYTSATTPYGVGDFTIPLTGSNFASILIPGVANGGYDTPASGTSIGGNIYIVYGTDRVDAISSCTRGVIAKSTDNAHTWTYLYDLSKGTGSGNSDITNAHFIRAHLEQVDAAAWPGLPWSSGTVLLLFGLSKSDTSTYLAAVPASSVETKSAIRYFTGLDATGNPTWGTAEAGATPIYANGASGDNASVLYLDILGKWIAAYGSGAYRLASKPWGPFSSTDKFWDITADDAAASYLHVSWATPPVKDGFWDQSTSPPQNQSGFGYSAQLIPRWCKGTPDGAELYYTLSTWNPYHPCVMCSEIGLPRPYEPAALQNSTLVPGDSNWQLTSSNFFSQITKFSQPHITTAPSGQVSASGMMWCWLPRDYWNQNLQFDVSGGCQDTAGAEVLVVEGTQDIPVTGSISTIYGNLKAGLYGRVVRSNWGVNDSTNPLLVSWDLKRFDRSNLKVVIIDKLTSGSWGFIDVSNMTLQRNVPSYGVATSTVTPGDSSWSLSPGSWNTSTTNNSITYFSTYPGTDATTGVAWRWLPRDWKNKQLDFNLLGGHAKVLLVQGVEPIPTTGDMATIYANLLAGSYGSVRAIAQGPDNYNNPAAVTWDLTASAGDKLKVVIIDSLTDSGGSVSVSPMTLTRYNTGNHAPAVLSNPFQVTDAQPNVAYTNTSANTKANFSDPDAGDTMTFSILDGPSWLSLGSLGKATGTPTNSDLGLNQWTVRVKDSQGEYCDAKMQVFVTVGNVAPVFLSNPTIEPDATQGIGYTGTGATLATAAFDPNYGTLTFAKVSGNPWLAVGSGGKLTGTPGLAVTGLNSFDVTVTDPTGPPVHTSLQIMVNPAPLVTTTSPLPNGMIGVGYSQSVSASGGTMPLAWTVSAGALPAGVTLGTNGALAGTPAASGTFNVTVQVTDKNGAVATMALALTVLSPALAPAATVLAGSNDVQLAWPGSTGLRYQVEYSPDLVQWFPAGNFTPGTGATMTWIDDGSQTGSAPAAETMRFYRLRISG